MCVTQENHVRVCECVCVCGVFTLRSIYPHDLVALGGILDDPNGTMELV